MRTKPVRPRGPVGGVPGEYTGRASRAYEYYHDECKAWAPVPLAATILAREGPP